MFKMNGLRLGCQSVLRDGELEGTGWGLVEKYMYYIIVPILF